MFLVRTVCGWAALKTAGDPPFYHQPFVHRLEIFTPLNFSLQIPSYRRLFLTLTSFRKIQTRKPLFNNDATRRQGITAAVP
jgi:hypothetical protein